MKEEVEWWKKDPNFPFSDFFILIVVCLFAGMMFSIVLEPLLKSDLDMPLSIALSSFIFSIANYIQIHKK